MVQKTDTELQDTTIIPRLTSKDSVNGISSRNFSKKNTKVINVDRVSNAKKFSRALKLILRANLG